MQVLQKATVIEQGEVLVRRLCVVDPQGIHVCCSSMLANTFKMLHMGQQLNLGHTTILHGIN
jgi:hypothetical protein